MCRKTQKSKAKAVIVVKFNISCCFQLPNHLFEELVMDVYDEIDRREIEASKLIITKIIYKNVT